MSEKTLLTSHILIPAGAFLMGDPSGLANEQPVHEVYLDAFYMDACVVTNSQFKDFLIEVPSWRKNLGTKESLNKYYLFFWRDLIYPKGKRDHPAVYVSWYVAAAYCNWRSLKEGFTPCYDGSNGFVCDFAANGYRLPTEAEYEKAARGGLQGQIYPWGNEIARQQANFDNHVGDTTEVGSYPPNAYGLFDMVGNVKVWCQDWYDRDYYQSSPTANPTGPASGAYKSFRNESWGMPASFLRCGHRSWMLPWNVNPDFGFRCVRRGS